MTDPYQILGVSRDASEDDIKKAYRTLSRKYHPDSNIGKSEAAQKAAEEKFKEVQKAYKAIVSGEAASQYDNQYGPGSSRGQSSYGQSAYGGRYSGYSGNYSSNYGGYGQYNYNPNGQGGYRSPEQSRNEAYYTACANYLRNRMYMEAYRTLTDIPDRDGRWYYYSAMANAGMGNQTSALSDIETAIMLEPNNMEYRRFAERLSNGGGWYTEVGKTYGQPDTSGSSVCVKICLFTICCGCSGGSSGCYFPLFCF